MEALLPTEIIKAEALRLGFSACGAAPAEAVSEKAADTFRQWLADGCQGEMAYMQNYEDKRLDPRLLVEGARTVISVALNYYPETKLPENEYQIEWSAYGKDYAQDVACVYPKQLFCRRTRLLRHRPRTRTLLGMACRTRLDREKHPAYHSASGFLLLFGRINY